MKTTTPLHIECLSLVLFMAMEQVHLKFYAKMKNIKLINLLQFSSSQYLFRIAVRSWSNRIFICIFTIFVFNLSKFETFYSKNIL